MASFDQPVVAPCKYSAPVPYFLPNDRKALSKRVCAALFALHPLNVEAVAWIAERKGVLCTFFWMLTLWSYLRYVERSKVGWYCLVVLFFILGGMAKPMIVTLPFVLLLLDYWPLERFKTSFSSARQTRKGTLSKFGPVTEKVPLFGIVIIIAIIGFVSQQKGGALTGIDTLPIGTRLSNAIVSYSIYLWKAVYPEGLTVFYPHRMIPAWQVFTSALFLSLVSLAVILLRKSRPYLAVGWFWYLGTFVPVIQLVQVGRHFTADRYAYIPLVGIFVMVVWGVSDLLNPLPHRKKILAFSGMTCLIVLGALAWRQAGYWSDSETLFEHGLHVVPNNYVAHNGLARALEAKGKTDEAIRHFETALRICPGYTDGRYNFARILAASGKKREASEQYRLVLKSDPDFAQAHVNLANILADEGHLNEAVKHYEKALTLNRENAKAHFNLANAFFRAGRIDDAIVQYGKALDIRPDDPGMHYNLGNAYMRNGNFDQAVYQYSEALRCQPDFVNARVNLGNALARNGNPRKAVVQYEKALTLAPDHAGAHYNLAGAFVALGETEKAIRHYNETVRLQPKDASARFQLGLILANSGRSSEAEMHFLNALQIRPDFVEARIALADALAVQGKTDEAVDEYNEAMKINPAVKGVVYYNLACLYALQHKVEESLECLRKAVENGFRDWNLLKRDKDLQNIRSADGYKRILSLE